MQVFQQKYQHLLGYSKTSCFLLPCLFNVKNTQQCLEEENTRFGRRCIYVSVKLGFERERRRGYYLICEWLVHKYDYVGRAIIMSLVAQRTTLNTCIKLHLQNKLGLTQLRHMSSIKAIHVA